MIFMGFLSHMLLITWGDFPQGIPRRGIREKSSTHPFSSHNSSLCCWGFPFVGFSSHIGTLQGEGISPTIEEKCGKEAHDVYPPKPGPPSPTSLAP